MRTPFIGSKSREREREMERADSSFFFQFQIPHQIPTQTENKGKDSVFNFHKFHIAQILLLDTCLRL